MLEERDGGGGKGREKKRPSLSRPATISTGKNEEGVKRLKSGGGENETGRGVGEVGCQKVTKCIWSVSRVSDLDEVKSGEGCLRHGVRGTSV